jgi:hypothetical protein
MRSTILLFFLSLCFTTYAQWNNSASVNNPVCNFSGNQTAVQVISDAAGGAIYTWIDDRNGTQDIYTQRVDANGTRQWNTNGIAICNATSDQFAPKLVADGSGGAIIVWYDNRSGEWDIYAQRINAGGTTLWTADGVSICTATGNQNAQQLISDGSGGAIITWSDGRTGGPNAEIYAQRINTAGTTLWPTNGVSVCNASSLQNIPQLVSDGSGGAIIAWEDWRNSQSDIYAQRISSNGITSWTFNGVAICSQSGAHQYNTKIVTDGSGGAIMCWMDNRNAGTNTDIYAQKVNSTGIAQWTANGIAICNASGLQLSPQMISDGASGAIMCWEDRRANRDIYTQRVNTSGTVQWIANGIPVCSDFGTQEEPQMVARISGGAVFLWTDDRNVFQQDIYAQAMDAAGNALWIVNGVAVANELSAQFAAQLISDGVDGAIIAWQDARPATDYDIYSSKLFVNGTLPLQLLSFSGAAENKQVSLKWITENEINTAYFDIEFSTDGITFNKLGTISAKNSAGINQYSFTHIPPAADVLFYRLKQADINGRTEYSKSIKITPQKNAALYVYPNPAGNYIQFKNNGNTMVRQLQVINAAGKLIMLPAANNSLRYDISSLKAGIYFLRIVNQDKSATVIPFTKQ